MSSESFEISVNGKLARIEADGAKTLLTALREELHVHSAKRGCNQGVCGSCTVLVDGEARRSCLTLAERCRGKDVRTIEGLANDAVMKALQQAMIAGGGVQCGFCTAGVLLSAHALLADTPLVDADDIRAALSGNICRCTGYRTIVEAVLVASREIAK